MKKQTRLFTVVLVGIIVFTLAISAAAETKQGGTLIIVTGDNPRHFNPAVQSGTPTGIPGSQIFASPDSLRRKLETTTVSGRELGMV